LGKAILPKKSTKVRVILFRKKARDRYEETERIDNQTLGEVLQ